MITVRKSKDRGYAKHDWLESYHSFSFADYFDEKNMGFRALRVINEDFIQPAEGFSTHSHRDMEIITYIIEGALEHKDSMGNGSIIRSSDAQYMSAGRGVSHSEFNAKSDQVTHLLQIWVLPDKKNYEPGYDQKTFSRQDKENKLCLLVSPGGENGSIKIRQDIKLFGSILKNRELQYTLDKKRYGWIQVIEGKLRVNDIELSAGDGAAISNTDVLNFSSPDSSEFLFFDLN